VSQGGDNTDDPQLKALRAVWLAMPDEEPPTRGLDALMAAARAQAEVLAAPPWWKRALHALARPPVLALATIMILIGGAVLISKRDDIKDAGPAAPPPVQTPAMAPTAPPPPPPEAETPRPTDQQQKLDVTTPTPPTTPTARPASRPAEPIEGRVEDAKPARPAHKAPMPARPEPKTTTTPTSPSAGAAFEPQDDAAKNRDGRGKVGGDEAQTADTVEAAPAQTRAPTPKQVIVDQLLVQCRSAATRGDCEEAKLIARRIAAQSTAYYKEHVASDAAIQKCITPPANAAPAAQ